MSAWVSGGFSGTSCLSVCVCLSVFSLSIFSPVCVGSFSCLFVCLFVCIAILVFAFLSLFVVLFLFSFFSSVCSSICYFISLPFSLRKCMCASRKLVCMFLRVHARVCVNTRVRRYVRQVHFPRVCECLCAGVCERAFWNNKNTHCKELPS